MKNCLKLSALALIVLLSLSATVMANTCPETKSELKKEVIGIRGLSLEYHTLFMQYVSSGESKSIQVSYGDREVYARFLGGEDVVMEYYDVQYFDEMDGECLQTMSVESIGGVSLAKPKQTEE